MVYCNLKGGLGNMMFQIAAVVSLAKENNTTASFPNLAKHLEYMNKETIHQPFMTHSHEYLSFLGNLNTESPTMNLLTIKYPFHFEEKSLPLCCWVDGFFQSEKYFLKNREELLNLFSPSKIHQSNFDKYEKHLNDESVSLHIRRGDYLRLSKAHFNLPIEYYTNSLKSLGNYDSVLIFSDDIPWCKRNIPKNDKNVFIDEKDYVSLFLMSMCKHNIISNSSFSWWGAWLNTNDNKRVIAPKKHFGPTNQHLNTDDIYPENWLRL